jgi:hypothetical protein
MYVGLHINYLYICPVLTNMEFGRQILLQLQSIKFKEIISEEKSLIFFT